MATALKNLCIYAAKIDAVDLSSGKFLSNTLYYRNRVDTGSGYGVDIAGTTDTALEDAIFHKWYDTVNPVMDRLPASYQLRQLTLQRLYGWGYGTPISVIVGAVGTLTNIHVFTAAPHGLRDGQTVQITGVVGMTDLNRMFLAISVVGPTEFVVDITTTQTYTSGGQVQRTNRSLQLLYADKLIVPHDEVGNSTEVDILPLFTDVSMRRLNTGVGKNFRSRISIAPIPESDQKNGSLLPTPYAAWLTIGTSLAATLLSGGVDFVPYAVSKKLALADTTPFSSSATWSRPVTSYAPQRNMGSFTKRKPKLTAAIAT